MEHLKKYMNNHKRYSFNLNLKTILIKLTSKIIMYLKWVGNCESGTYNNQ